MNLTLVPYGNAKTNVLGTVTCQHGEQECEGNRWEQCAIAKYPQQSQYFEFYYCMEKFADKMLDNVQNCAKQANMEYSTLESCFNSNESKELQKAAAAMTPKDHQYVPWVLVNGKKSPSDGDDILKEVCEAYEGEPPKACANLKANKARCYTE